MPPPPSCLRHGHPGRALETPPAAGPRSVSTQMAQLTLDTSIGAGLANRSSSESLSSSGGASHWRHRNVAAAPALSRWHNPINMESYLQVRLPLRRWCRVDPDQRRRGRARRLARRPSEGAADREPGALPWSTAPTHDASCCARPLTCGRVMRCGPREGRGRSGWM